MRPRATLLGLFAASVSSAPLAAQFPDLQPGARVRFAAPGLTAGRRQGMLLSRPADSLVIVVENGAQVRVPIASLSELSVDRGKSAAGGAKKGFLWGAALTLPIFVLAPVCERDECSAGDRIGLAAYGSAIWGGIGAAIGALVGSERWTAYDLTRLATSSSIEVSGGAVRVGLRARF